MIPPSTGGDCVAEDDKKGKPKKAKRPIAAILSYLTLCVDQIMDAYPSGKLPPIDQITLRDPKDLEPFLKEPYAPGWKSVFELPQMGPFTKG